MKNDRFVPGMAAGAVLGGLIVAALTAAAQTGTPAPAKPPIPTEELRHFAEVYGAVKTGYVEPLDDRKLIGSCLTGMVGSLDGRSEFLDAEAFRELQGASGPPGDSGIAGIGAEFKLEADVVRIVTALDDAPALRAGVRSGDFIVTIDGMSTKGVPLRDVVKKLRGRPGTDVRLGVVRQGESQPLEITVRREIIRVRSVSASMLDDGFALVRVSQLRLETGGQLAAQLRALYAGPAKAPQGIVLDLRDSPGGLLNGAIAVSAVFLERGATVGTTDGRIEEAKRQYRAVPQDFLRGGQADFTVGLPTELGSVPLAVLVNRGTASGSEIIAGALQDHKRATILGEKTFGLGSIQTIMPTNYGTALKLTTARWFRPGGASIEARAITPDVPVAGAQSRGTTLADPVVAAAVAALKR